MQVIRVSDLVQLTMMGQEGLALWGVPLEQLVQERMDNLVIESCLCSLCDMVARSEVSLQFHAGNDPGTVQKTATAH